MYGQLKLQRKIEQFLPMAMGTGLFTKDNVRQKKLSTSNYFQSENMENLKANQAKYTKAKLKRETCWWYCS